MGQVTLTYLSIHYTPEEFHLITTIKEKCHIKKIN